MCDYRVITNGETFRAQFRPGGYWGWLHAWRDVGNYGETTVATPYATEAIARAVIREDRVPAGHWRPVEAPDAR